MLAIDEISGVFDHSAACDEQIEMERNPRIPLHPELRTYALEELREQCPLYLLHTKCANWVEQKWPGLVGNNHSRFCLTSHDSLSLYRTIAREHGIHQRTGAEENLDQWFCEQKPRPPSPLL
jgi:hypothetical protein